MSPAAPAATAHVWGWLWVGVGVHVVGFVPVAQPPVTLGLGLVETTAACAALGTLCCRAGFVVMERKVGSCKWSFSIVRAKDSKPKKGQENGKQLFLKKLESSGRGSC